MGLDERLSSRCRLACLLLLHPRARWVGIAGTARICFLAKNFSMSRRASSPCIYHSSLEKAPGRQSKNMAQEHEMDGNQKNVAFELNTGIAKDTIWVKSTSRNSHGCVMICAGRSGERSRPKSLAYVDM